MKKEFAMALLLLALGTAGNLAAAIRKARWTRNQPFRRYSTTRSAAVEREFVPAAEAMPDDKFNFAPTQGDFKGVRTFAQQIKHVSAVNYMLGAAILSEKPPVELGSENGPDNITSKADVVKFMKDSFAYLHKALNTIDESNVLVPDTEPVWLE